MIWRFRGAPQALAQQGDRLGVSKILTDRARHNPELHRVSILAGQLCERYHRARGPGPGTASSSVPLLPRSELAQVRGTLGQIEQEVAKLHAIAAAAAAVSDEAHRAYGLEPPARPFAVLSDFDCDRAGGPGFPA